ncbi:hypothetical protein M1N20_00920, partial [Dehalococcoidia bacterium]|nr:hypothetical protein [Dehalococcoidia bacterium]
MEDESTCIVYGMPRSVVESGNADTVVPLPEIAGEINSRCRRVSQQESRVWSRESRVTSREAELRPLNSRNGDPGEAPGKGGGNCGQGRCDGEGHGREFRGLITKFRPGHDKDTPTGKA